MNMSRRSFRQITVRRTEIGPNRRTVPNKDDSPVTLATTSSSFVGGPRMRFIGNSIDAKLARDDLVVSCEDSAGAPHLYAIHFGSQSVWGYLRIRCVGW